MVNSHEEKKVQLNTTKRLKIVFVTEAYWDVMNGVVMMVKLLARELVARGHTVSIITPSSSRRGTAVLDGSVICSVPALSLPGGVGYSVALPWLSKDAAGIMRDADVIHTHHPFLLGSWALQFGKPIFFTSHTNYLAYLHYVPLIGTVLRQPLAYYLRHFCNRCAVIIAPAKDAAVRLRTYGVKRSTVVIPNGIEIERFAAGNRSAWRSRLQLSRQSSLLLYVGRLAKEKRVNVLVQAFCTLPGSTHLLLVGGGPLELELRTYAHETGLGSRIHFAGQVRNEELPDIYAAADLFVTASDSEVHPLVLLEAQAAGLAAVVVDAPGVAEIVQHNSTGLVTKNTPEGFQNGLLKLAFDPHKIHQMGQNAQEHAKRYSLSSSVDSLLALYLNQ